MAGLNAALLPQHQSGEMKILNNSFPRLGIEPTTIYSHTLVVSNNNFLSIPVEKNILALDNFSEKVLIKSLKRALNKIITITVWF